MTYFDLLIRALKTQFVSVYFYFRVDRASKFAMLLLWGMSPHFSIDPINFGAILTGGGVAPTVCVRYIDRYFDPYLQSRFTRRNVQETLFFTRSCPPD